MVHLHRLLLAAGASYFCHSHKSNQKGLAVAITSLPHNPSLARAQQRASALLLSEFTQFENNRISYLPAIQKLPL